MRLDEYYRNRGFSPTFANFQTVEQLRAYEAMRTAMFRDRLALPPRIFRGARLLEFGPDTGENALTFAGWGASVTLVEPNPAAHAAIRTYFEQFGRAASLVDISTADVLTYRSDERFDVVVAEGFIHTVKPVRAWLDAFAALLADDGLFVVSFYGRYGGLIELALRALYAAYRRATGADALAAAEALYRAKWDAIPHTRSFASWVYDVLDNPLQSLAAYVDAAAFVDDVRAAGFDLYASYPRYNDVLEMDWHKYVVSPDERAARARRHLRRSTLSFLTGRTLYVCDEVDGERIAAEADAVLAALDALYWAEAPAEAARAADGFAALSAAIGEAALVDNGRAEREPAIAAFRSFASAFASVAAGRAADVPSLTQSDAAFIAAWGSPNHHAVGRRC